MSISLAMSAVTFCIGSLARRRRLVAGVVLVGVEGSSQCTYEAEAVDASHVRVMRGTCVYHESCSALPTLGAPFSIIMRSYLVQQSPIHCYLHVCVSVGKWDARAGP